MNRIKYTFTICLFFLFVQFAKSQESNIDNITPKPVQVTRNQAPFHLSNQTSIQSDAKLTRQATYLKNLIAQQTGLNLPLSKKAGTFIGLRITNGGKPESYELKTYKDSLVIAGRDIKGVVNGIQTLLQLLPLTRSKEVTIPGVSITDYPRFAYRGMHLDVVRHFFDTAYIKKYIDYLTFHKFNTFHWHLTDDQGWRIEMLSYKKLNTIGSWRDATLIGHFFDKPIRYDSTRYGGYYTRAEIKDIIDYASVRGINIIPEIDIPGHCRAVIAAYPEFSTRPDTTWNVAITWGMFNRQNNVLAPRKATFDFLKTVYQEIADLFTSPYIHLGGDECSKMWWKQDPETQKFIREKGLKDEDDLQAYFIKQVSTYLTEKKKKVIGWHEIMEGEIDPSDIIMDWKNDSIAIAATKKNHSVIMTPSTPLYLNQYQSKVNKDSLAAGGYNPLESVYNYDPISARMDKRYQGMILGAQGCVWTEYIGNSSKVDYVIFPRLTALSEVLWSPKESKDYKDFLRRLPSMQARYQFWNSHYFKSNDYQ